MNNLLQISAFLGNEKIKINEIVNILSKNSINIRALCIAETDNYGTLRLIVESTKVEFSLNLLKENGIICSFTEVLAIEIPDVLGGLSHILNIFSENGLNPEYLYTSLEKNSDNAIIIMGFSDIEKAKLVSDKNKLILLNNNNFD